MAIFKEREAAIDYLRGIVGELGRVEDRGNVIIGLVPTKDSMYNFYKQEAEEGKGKIDELEFDEYYKMESSSGAWLQLFVKRGSIWVKM